MTAGLRKLPLCLVALVLQIAFVTGLHAVEPDTSRDTSSSPGEEDLPAVQHCQLDVWIDGTPLSARWESVIGHLFDLADTDGSGGLDESEATRLPSEYGLREKLWGQYLASRDEGPSWESLDANGDGSIFLDELIACYESAGLRGVVISVGRCPWTSRLNEELVNKVVPRLLSVKDREDAAQLIADFDADKNESISPGELVVDITYPGTSATTHLPAVLTARSPHMPQPALVCSVPVVNATYLFFQPVTNYKHRTTETDLRGGKPSALVLKVELNSATDDAHFLGNSESGGNLPHDTVALGTTKLGVAVVPGKSMELWEAAKQRFCSQFESASQGGNAVSAGYETKLQSRLADLDRLLSIADKNLDRTLTRQELEQWLAVQEGFVETLVQISVIDFGTGLFELFDTSRNGLLSASELLDASKWLRERGHAQLQQPELSDPPHQLRILIGRGSPKTLLNSDAVQGPSWFKALDQNQDGSITKSEFPADQHVFEEMDANGDGTIDSKEARASSAKW